MDGGNADRKRKDDLFEEFLNGAIQYAPSIEFTH